MKRYPKTLYVKTEEEGDSSYFVAVDDPLDIAEPGSVKKVAIYALVETVELESKVEIKRRRS